MALATVFPFPRSRFWPTKNLHATYDSYIFSKTGHSWKTKNLTQHKIQYPCQGRSFPVKETSHDMRLKYPCLGRWLLVNKKPHATYDSKSRPRQVVPGKTKHLTQHMIQKVHAKARRLWPTKNLTQHMIQQQLPKHRSWSTTYLTQHMTQNPCQDRSLGSTKDSTKHTIQNPCQDRPSLVNGKSHAK